MMDHFLHPTRAKPDDKPNVCKLEKGVGKPTGAAVGTRAKPSLDVVTRVSRVEPRSGERRYNLKVRVEALFSMSCCLGTG